MKDIFANVIGRGGYNLTELLRNIDRYHIEGKLTDEEREELYTMARQTPEAQYDVRREIELLWAAVRAIQSGGNAAPEQGDEWPEFVQPTGAHDAYQTGHRLRSTVRNISACWITVFGRPLFCQAHGKL